MVMVTMMVMMLHELWLLEIQLYAVTSLFNIYK